jgi:hypothetical protein
MSNTIKIRVKGGYIVASISGDIDYPGIDVEYVADDDKGEMASRPKVLIEYPKDGCLRALVWNDPHNEDYADEINLM